MAENESNEISKTVGDSITSNNSSDIQTNQTLYIKQFDFVELHWKINREDNGELKITFDKTCLPVDIVYDGIYNPKIIYNRNYVSRYRITQCALVSDNIGGVAFTIKGGENGKWFTNYNVIIDKSKFIKTNLLLPVNDDVREEYNTSDSNTTYRTTAPFTRNQNISLPVSSPDDDIDFSVVDNFTINISDADKNKIKILSGDLYISVSLSYYIYINDDDSDLDDEDETLPSISGNFFSPGEVLYYIEGNYIKKIVVREIELTWEKPADVDIMEQTSLTDIHGRTGIDEKTYIDDYKLFIDKDNLINCVTGIDNDITKPKYKYFYVKYRLGDSVYSLLNDSVHYAKITKVTYTESKSLVDYTTNIDIKYTLQDGTEEWIVSEDNVFADKSDIKTIISDELSVEDSNNLIYLGCDVCDVKK